MRSQLSIEDDALIRDTLAGRTEAFGKLVTKHHHVLFDLTFRMLGNREEAEDVTQQVFIEAFRHLAGFRGGSQFSTWLYSIALNRARNHLRSRKTRRHVSIDDTGPDHDDAMPMQLPDTTPRPDQIVEKQFNLDWVRNEVSTLSNDYRDIFSLHYFQNIPLQEIAKKLNRPLGTVKVYLHRARRDLCNRWAIRNKITPVAPEAK